MKNLLLFIILSFFLSGCGALKFPMIKKISSEIEGAISKKQNRKKVKIENRTEQIITHEHNE